MELCKQIGTICVSFNLDGTQIAFPIDFIMLDPYDIEWVYKFGLYVPDKGRFVMYLCGKVRKDKPIIIHKEKKYLSIKGKKEIVESGTIDEMADFDSVQIECVGDNKITGLRVYPIDKETRSKLLKTMRKLKIRQYPLQCFIN